MKRKLLKQIIALFVPLITTATLKAQSTATALPADSMISKLSSSLNISKSTAMQLQAVLHQSVDVNNIMKNPKLSMAQKQKQLGRAMQEYHHKIGLLLTASQRKLLAQQQTGNTQQQAAALAGTIQKHEASLSGVPHQHTVIKPLSRDSINTKL